MPSQNFLQTPYCVSIVDVEHTVSPIQEKKKRTYENIDQRPHTTRRSKKHHSFLGICPTLTKAASGVEVIHIHEANEPHENHCSVVLFQQDIEHIINFALTQKEHSQDKACGKFQAVTEFVPLPIRYTIAIDRPLKDGPNNKLA